MLFKDLSWNVVPTSFVCLINSSSEFHLLLSLYKEWERAIIWLDVSYKITTFLVSIIFIAPYLLSNLTYIKDQKNGWLNVLFSKKNGSVRFFCLYSLDEDAHK
jgi:hypothetical protein